jgi:ankyrin repeat protein
MMNAVQSNKIDHLQLLINAGAEINARDNRGFTALHRAAEMGLGQVVELLLSHNANVSVEAEGHTALSLAEGRGETQIANLLRRA